MLLYSLSVSIFRKSFSTYNCFSWKHFNRLPVCSSYPIYLVSSLADGGGGIIDLILDRFQSVKCLYCRQCVHTVCRNWPNIRSFWPTPWRILSVSLDPLMDHWHCSLHVYLPFVIDIVLSDAISHPVHKNWIFTIFSSCRLELLINHPFSYNLRKRVR